MLLQEFVQTLHKAYHTKNKKQQTDFKLIYQEVMLGDILFLIGPLAIYTLEWG